MSEKSAVQDPLLKYAAEIGWEYVKPADAEPLRGSIGGQFFTDILAAQLQRLNPSIMDAARTADVLRRLRLLPASIEGNRDALKWLRGEMSVYVDTQKRERNVTLIDFDTPANNVYHVTEEWRHQSAAYTNRADVVFLINGVPVAITELKAAEKPDGAAEGVQQIRRYHKETPEMLIMPQVFEVSQMLDFLYGATWAANRKNLLNWKEDAPGNFEVRVKAFFQQDRFLRMLKEYVLFLSKDDVLSKVILRQHQTRAVEKVMERACDPTKRRGLIWHTQGSGKTLTMLTIASNLLRANIAGEKPTVIMLVDRNELESQMFQNVAAYGIDSVQVAGSKRELQRLLAADHRGLIVSMIHKFDDVPANLNTRQSIVVLVDEAHRTTGGDLGNFLLAALPNATYIGFTGTPIDATAKGKGTFKTFGVDDAQGYLDKYNIAESVEDGTTLTLNYALAPVELRVDRTRLESEFLNLTTAEGVTDIEELNAILDRAVTLKTFLKGQARVDNIAAFIGQHFRDVVEPLGFKAFVVAVDREACVLYKEALDKHLPPDVSRVVISPAHNDDETLKKHYLDEATEKDVRKNFLRNDKKPQILIVTEKLLTGFDAPILYCLYLDKPMRDHVLLQTVARVNRPYDDDQGRVKPCGLIVDFVGIFERLEKALAFDSDTVASVVRNIDVLKTLFETMLREQAPAYLPLAKGWTDKDKERAIDHFADAAIRDAFFKFYKQLAILYDILSPDAFLRPHIKDYQNLSLLYALIRNAQPRVYVDKELTAKTRALLGSATEAATIDLPGQIYTLTATELAALRQGDTSDTSKVLNLRKALAVVVDTQSASKPFVISIGERAEALAKAYEDKQVTTQQALEAYDKMAQEYVNAEDERATLNIDENTYAIYAVLRPLVPSATPAQTQSLNALFEQYPDFAWDDAQGRTLRSALYALVRPLVGARMVDVTNTLMKLQRV